MVCPASLKVRQQVKRELAIRLGVLDRLALSGRFRLFAVRLGVLEGPRFLPLENESTQTAVCEAGQQTLLERRMVIPNCTQLVHHP